MHFFFFFFFPLLGRIHCFLTGLSVSRLDILVSILESTASEAFANTGWTTFAACCSASI